MNSRTPSLRLSTLVQFIGALLLSHSLAFPLHSATLYKWVDESGAIRYSDTLPTEQAKKGFQQIAPDGRIIVTREAAKSREELQRERREKKQREEEMRIKAEELARAVALKEHTDNVLLMTFTDETEIIEAKNERLAVIDSVIQLLHKNIATEQNKLKAEEQIAKQQYTDQNKPIPGGQAQKIEYFIEKVLSKQHLLELKLEERERVKQQYISDLMRFRELKKQKAQDAN